MRKWRKRELGKRDEERQQTGERMQRKGKGDREWDGSKGDVGEKEGENRKRKKENRQVERDRKQMKREIMRRQRMGRE